MVFFLLLKKELQQLKMLKVNNKHSQDGPEEIFNKEVFEHILNISRGECNIVQEDLGIIENESRRDVLGGLAMLFDDLQLYKSDLKESLEAEYKIKMLLKKNQELEQFNQIASHDMKEPLRTITSFTELLHDRYQHVLDKEGLKYLRFINDASGRMSSLIQGLLNYSRVGAEINIEKVDCNNILMEVQKDLTSRIQETNAQIIVDKLPAIKADPTAIRQLFQNLLSNSLKFHSNERQPIIKISNKSNVEKDTFCVEDNGIGIDASQSEKIFGLFNRLHTRSDIEGTGLGLSICKKIVEAHKGELWLESEVGLGTKFFFFIPSA